MSNADRVEDEDEGNFFDFVMPSPPSFCQDGRNFLICKEGLKN
jgi:hypothetical protein